MTEWEPLVPTIGLSLAEPFALVVGVAADDVDDTRYSGLLGQRLIPSRVDRIRRIVREMMYSLQQDGVVAGMWICVDSPVTVEREHGHLVIRLARRRRHLPTQCFQELHLLLHRLVSYGLHLICEVVAKLVEPLGISIRND